MRFFFLLIFSLIAWPGWAAGPQLRLEVARFRNEDKSVKGAVVELYATVAGQSLLYRQRAPKSFQAAATVTLEILREDGQSAYREVITLKPPVLKDTTISLKNPLSFQKRILLPDGHYTLRGQVRDQQRSETAVTTVEQSFTLGSGSPEPALSDIVLLAQPAAKSPGQSTFARGGYALKRAPDGLYARGADQLYFYAELYNAPAGQLLTLRYHLESDEGAAADADSPLGTAAAGRPTSITGELPFGPLPTDNYTLRVEVVDGRNKVLAAQTVRLRRETEDYTPAGPTAPR